MKTFFHVFCRTPDLHNAGNMRVRYFGAWICSGEDRPEDVRPGEEELKAEYGNVVMYEGCDEAIRRRVLAR